MKEYNIFWKKFLIGNLYINDKNMYKLIYNKDNVEKAKKDGMASYLLPEEAPEYGDPIPFFKDRLNKNIKNLKVIKYHTDNFRIEIVK